MSDLQAMIVIWTASAATAADPVIQHLFQKLIREAQEQIGIINDQYQHTIETIEQTGI